MKKPKTLKTTFSTYTISSVLGHGGSGIVYLATDHDSEPVAIKCLNSDQTSRDKLKRFKNEFIFCSKTEHPNLIKVIDHGITENSESFFVMPAYESSLRAVVGTLNPEEAFLVFGKILDGVEAAHKYGVTHRDLKPENILIRNRGNDLVIADFGIAHFEEEDLYTAVETKDGTRLANFQYAAPEQRTRGKIIGQTADIYALGLIFNELFTSEVPHGTQYRKVADVAQNFAYLDQIIEKMLAQDPTNRFGSIDLIKRELIARGREHIARQRLSETKKQVVFVGEVDDPIVEEPMKIVGVDWNSNTLTIHLNHNVNEQWVWAIRNMGGHTSLLGKGPEIFNFRGKHATISASSGEAQQIVDYFKQWLPRANQVYANKLKENRAKEELRLKKELEQKIKEEEERTKVLSNLKF